MSVKREITVNDLLSQAVRESSKAMAYDLLAGYLDACSHTKTYPYESWTDEYTKGVNLCDHRKTRPTEKHSEILRVIRAIQDL